MANIEYREPIAKIGPLKKKDRISNIEYECRSEENRVNSLSLSFEIRLLAQGKNYPSP
jgi:hypothetical protein